MSSMYSRAIHVAGGAGTQFVILPTPFQGTLRSLRVVRQPATGSPAEGAGITLYSRRGAVPGQLDYNTPHFYGTEITTESATQIRLVLETAPELSWGDPWKQTNLTSLRLGDQLVLKNTSEASYQAQPFVVVGLDHAANAIVLEGAWTPLNNPAESEPSSQTVEDTAYILAQRVSELETTPVVAPELYQLMIASWDSEKLSYTSEDLQLRYANQDLQEPIRRRGQSQLYLEIVPGVSGDAHYLISYVIENESIH